MAQYIFYVNELQNFIVIIAQVVTIYFTMLIYLNTKNSKNSLQLSFSMRNYLIINFFNAITSLPHIIYLALAWKPCKTIYIN